MASRRTILVVDDHPLMRATLCAALEDEGYEVFEAPDGRVALEMLLQIGRPCAVLLDLEMPVMDGSEFLRQLHQRPDGNEFPVILCTASGRTKPSGVQGVVTKPFSLGTLLATVAASCH